MNRDPIHDILASAKLRPETLARVEQLIEDLHRALSDYDLDELFDALGNGEDLIQGIRPGGMSRGGFPGSGGDIIVIPGREPGYCAPIVLALARGRTGRASQRVPSVMREVRAHLISCFEIAEVVILLTDQWDPALLKESEPDFSAHAARPVGRKVLIPLVAWKRQLTGYAWP